MDVILGRGKSFAKHPGNRIFQGKGTYAAEVYKLEVFIQFTSIS
jgi:hypothetical protein